MRKFLILAGALLPLAAAQAQPIAPNCGGVIEASGWQSQNERGYWASSVDLRNLSGQPVQVTVSFNGVGAMNRPGFRMEAGGWQRIWLARTARPVAAEALRTSTTLVCGAPG